MGLERDRIETEGFFGFAPDGLEDFGLVFGNSPVFREEFENSPLFRGKFVGFSFAHDLHSVEIHFEPGDLGFGFDGFFLATGYRADSRDEFFAFERLDQVIVGSKGERFDLVGKKRVGSEREHRRGVFGGAEFAEKFASSHDGHVHVEHDGRIRMAQSEFESLFSSDRFVGFHSGQL